MAYMEKFGHQRIPSDDTSPNYKPEYVRLHRWAVWQRRHYRKGELADWRYNLLAKAGFLFEPLDTYWERNYQKLVKFKEINGHCNVSRFDMQNLRLGKWICDQRFHKKRLSPERIKKLDDIGFDWGIKRNKWDDMYEWLKKYYLEHGVAYVQRDMSNGYSGTELNYLNRWCGKQIWYYKRSRLPQDKIRMLNEINFDFNHRTSIIVNAWEKNFNKLLEFKKRFGHYNVPIKWEDDKLLAYWVQRQRVYKNRLPPEKIQRLDAIGFSWDYKEDHWETNFEALKKHQLINGHCNVLHSYDDKLAEWVHYMRKVRKGNYNYKLTGEQINKLDNIGFDWYPRDTFWENRFNELLEFKKEHGHCRIKQNDGNKQLFIWCRSHRLNIVKITMERKKRLEEIGFEWDADVAYRKRNNIKNINNSDDPETSSVV
jgi:hypothetical protein